MAKPDYDGGRDDLETRLRAAIIARVPGVGLRKVAVDSAYDADTDGVVIVVTVRRNLVKKSRLLRRSVNIGGNPARTALIASLREELAEEFSS